MKSEYLSFLKELPSSFHEIGAALPSSPFLGREMVKAVREAKGPINILEVGPGTGPITRQILRHMDPDDHLTVCEINQKFLNLLRERLSRNSDFLKNQDRVQFLRAPVQQLPNLIGEERFDVIVSSLPFSNFSADMVEEITRVLEALLAPGGSITVLEYLGLRKLGLAFSSPERRDRLQGVERVLQQWRNRVKKNGRVRTRVTFLNVPPALAIQFRYSAELPEKRHLLGRGDELEIPGYSLSRNGSRDGISLNGNSSNGNQVRGRSENPMPGTSRVGSQEFGKIR